GDRAAVRAWPRTRRRRKRRRGFGEAHSASLATLQSTKAISAPPTITSNEPSRKNESLRDTAAMMHSPGNRKNAPKSPSSAATQPSSRRRGGGSGAGDWGTLIALSALGGAPR